MTQGKIVTSPKEIVQVFEEHYQTLYTQPDIPDSFHLSRKFLEQGTLSTLPADLLTDLNAPITHSELMTAIKHLPTHKVPGPDGLMGNFYKMLHDEVAETLLKVYYGMCLRVSYLPSCKKAYFKLIPKQDKDTSPPSSYPSILLLNIDEKILSK